MCVMCSLKIINLFLHYKTDVILSPVGFWEVCRILSLVWKLVPYGSISFELQFFARAIGFPKKWGYRTSFCKF